MCPVILGFTSKIQVNAHLDDKTCDFTGVSYIVHLQTLLTYAGEGGSHLQYSQILKCMAVMDISQKQSLSEPSLPPYMTKICSRISPIVSTPCISSPILSLSLSCVSWPAAVAAHRRALLMMVLKDLGK